jgi:hypothetical protein
VPIFAAFHGGFWDLVHNRRPGRYSCTVIYVDLLAYKGVILSFLFFRKFVLNISVLFGVTGTSYLVEDPGATRLQRSHSITSISLYTSIRNICVLFYPVTMGNYRLCVSKKRCSDAEEKSEHSPGSGCSSDRRLTVHTTSRTSRRQDPRAST